jgi:hypothetical protein
MPIIISEETKNSIMNRINALYELCGNINPIVYFIEGLTAQFNSIKGSNNCKAFEVRLREAENNMLVYYNRDGVSKDIAESIVFNHLILYKVQPINESEAKYFFHLELANLFIRASVKKTLDIKHHLSKIFNGYSVAVTSPLFFG